MEPVVFTTTCYGSLDDWRCQLALATCSACAALGYPLIVCDASPDAQIGARFAALGATVVRQVGAGAKGDALRQALARAAELARGAAGPRLLAFQEPEKTDMVSHWAAVCAHVCARGPPTGVAVVPARHGRLFRDSYAREQHESETFLNTALNALAAGAGLRTALDWAFGPFALSPDLAHVWLSCDGALWEAQLAGIARAWRGGARVLAVEVAYRHPPAQKAAEEGKVEWVLKRAEQLSRLVPLMHAEFARAPQSSLARDGGAPGSDGGGGAGKLVLITGAGGNLGVKIARHLLVHAQPHRVRLVDRLDTDAVRARLLSGAAAAVVAAVSAAPERVEALQLDLCEWSGALVRAMHGVDACIHLAAQNPFPEASWADCAASCDIHAHVLEAAARAHVPRLLLASSNHVLGNHWRDGAELRPEEGAGALGAGAELRPGTRFDLAPVAAMDCMPYAAAKLFGERLGAAVARCSPSTRVLAVRIGWCQPGENRPATLSVTGTPTIAEGASAEPPHGPDAAARHTIEAWFKSMWLSNADLGRLVDAALSADLSALPRSDLVVLNGVSANARSRWSVENPIGYGPQEDVHAAA